MTRLVDTNVIKKNKLKKGMEDPFFNAKNPFVPYEDLNDTIVPTPEMIKEYQLQKIESFQKIALNKKAKDYEWINELFKSGAINTLVLQDEQKTELHINKIISGIVGDMNKIWNIQVKGPGSAKEKYDKIIPKITALETTLSQLQAQLNITSSAYAEMLNRIRELLQEAEIGDSLSSQNITNWAYNLNKLKGDVVEEIGTAWLRKRIPDLNTITTGALELRNIHNEKAWSPSYGASPGQLISDILTLYVKNVNLLRDTRITYRLDGEIKYDIPLEDFLNEIEHHTGNSHIAIDNKGYETLLSLSQLNIQAKAGFKQLPWNEKSKNTHVTISEFQDEEGNIKTKYAFELLHHLDNDEETKDWLYDTHDSYNALANYGLATVLYKTLHLSEYGNQVLLTPMGFTSFTDRLTNLLKEKTDYIEIATRVHVNDNTLNNEYKVTIVK